MIFSRLQLGVSSLMLLLNLLSGCASVSTAPDTSAATSGQVNPQINPQMQAVLDARQTLGAQPLEQLTPQQARQQPTMADAARLVLKQQSKPILAEPVGKVENRSIQGAAGPIPIRIYTPAVVTSGAPLPVVLYVHGGGWVVADLDTYDATPRALANQARAIVVSTHYRQAPEYKFPAAHEDVFTAYLWVLKNANSFNGDARRVAVAGESAGATMAAAVGLLARHHRVTQPVHQLLVYPVADYGFDSPSYKQWAQAQPLNAAAMKWFFTQALANPADGNNGLISLVDVPDLKRLPPATVITAEIDPLKSEGQQLAERLKAAGIAVDYRNFDGVTHEFFGLTAVVDQARTAMSFAAGNLRKAFGQ